MAHERKFIHITTLNFDSEVRPLKPRELSANLREWTI